MIEQKRPLKQVLPDYTTLVRNLLKVVIPAAVLVACSSNNNPNDNNNIAVTGNMQHNAKKQVGILLPLTGRNGALGNNMLKAAQLAMSDAASLDVYDTSSPGGIQAAANKAIAQDGIVLGPLTGKDTTEVASLTRSENLPIISYSSDVSVAGSNVWAFGITPEQQVLTMVQAAKNEGRHKFAAFLPDNAFGRAMADGLIKACSDLGLSQPVIVYHINDKIDIDQKLKNLSDYDMRMANARQNVSEKQENAGSEDSSKIEGDSLQNELIPSKAVDHDKKPAPVTLGSPPFDALLLADTGLQLQSVINTMQESQLLTDRVRIMGPGLWSSFAGKLGMLKGAWYAAPDPVYRQEFVKAYMTKYGQSPKPLADLAYDSAAMVNALKQQDQEYSVDHLARPQGFNGVDGYFALQPDGSVQRKLKIFEIQPMGGGKMLPDSGK